MAAPDANNTVSRSEYQGDAPMTDLVEECQSSDGDVDGNTFCWQDRRRSFDDVLSQGVPAVMSDVPAGGVAKVGQSRLGKVLDPETLPQRSVEVGRVGRAAAELMASPVCERSTQAENQGEVAAPCGMRDGGAAEAASVQDLKIIGRSCCSGIDDGGKGDASCSDLEGDGDKRAAMHHRGGKKTLLSLQPLAARCCYDGCCQVTVFRCQRCRIAFYCSREHQRDHWGRHRGECVKGKGLPPPRLAQLTLVERCPHPPSRSNAKAVGWADSARSSAHGKWRPRLGPSELKVPGRGDSDYLSTPAVGQGSREDDYDTDYGSASRAESSRSFRENKSRLAALMGSSSSGAAGGVGGFISQIRTAPRGASWTVPSSGNGPGKGSAEVWPAAGAASGLIDSNCDSGRVPEAASIRNTQRRGRSASPPPQSLRSTQPRIPSPASRPLDAMCSSLDVDMLAEMGFERGLASKALTSFGGNVDRAVEWLLTAASGGDYDDRREARGMSPVRAMYGPHLPGAGGGHNGGAEWGSVTRLGVLGEDTSASGGIVGGENITHTRGGYHGDRGEFGSDDDDDLITRVDASDVGQGLDKSDSWKVDGGVGSGDYSSAGIEPGIDRHSEYRGGAFATDLMEEERDENRLVTSYEGVVGGAVADIVMFYRSAKSVCTVTAAAIARESTICDLVDGTTSAGVVGNVGVGIGSGGASGGDGDAGMLTLIVRPLPSTAPASLASDSSRGEGAEYERHDPSRDLEHVLTLSWALAEEIALRHQTAQRDHPHSTAGAMATSEPGDIPHSVAGPSSGVNATEIFSPKSPPARDPQASDGAGHSSPRWGRKNEVGRLIIGTLERRVDGGYQACVPEVTQPSGAIPAGANAVVVARTYERPRGRSLPKWGGQGGGSAEFRSPPPPRQTPPPPPKWSSYGSGLEQAWNCETCTFRNEDPDFRTVCEMCDSTRPEAVAGGAKGRNQRWDFRSDTEELHEAALSSSRATHGPVQAAIGCPPATTAFDTHAMGDSRGGGATGSAVDDAESVDGILGGVSPVGGLPSPTFFASSVAARSHQSDRSSAELTGELTNGKLDGAEEDMLKGAHMPGSYPGQGLLGSVETCTGAAVRESGSTHSGRGQGADGSLSFTPSANMLGQQYGGRAATTGHAAGGLTGIDWDVGAEWEGIGCKSFGDSPVTCSPSTSGKSHIGKDSTEEKGNGCVGDSARRWQEDTTRVYDN